MDPFEVVKDINLFARNLLLKVMHNKKPITTEQPTPLTAAEFRAIRDLNILLEEGGLTESEESDTSTDSDEEQDKRIATFRKKSHKFPPKYKPYNCLIC